MTVSLIVKQNSELFIFYSHKNKKPALGWFLYIGYLFYSPSKKLLSCSEREG